MTLAITFFYYQKNYLKYTMYSNLPFMPVSYISYLETAYEINSPGSERPPGKPKNPFLSPCIFNQ